MVPDLLSGTFYGREDVLECVHRSLLRGRQTSEISRTAIWGLPGIGKTQIALCYERRHRSDYRHVFFVNASGAETIVTTYRAFLQALFPDKTGFDRLDNAEVEKLMKAWLARNPNWLLIYDNAISPGAVRQYTPVDGRGHIIFTTRNEIAAEALVEREEAFEIFALPPQHAVPFILLLQKIVLDAASTHDEQVAQHLAKTLLGIPIAIEQSVLLARLRNVPLSTILPEVETRRTLFQQTHPASMHEYECSTGALVSMTLETLATRSPPAASLFQLLVFCHTSSIPIEMITKGSKQLDFHFARQEIYNQGLRRSAQEIQEMRLQSAGRRPFYEENPFEKSFWKSRIPFQAKPKSNQLPRVDSAADKAVEKFYKGNHVLRDVLEKEVRIENAILDLKEAGLVRSPNDKTIWIHDLFAQLTIASVEEESQELARNVAHLVLLTIYLSFPIPYAGINSQLCDLHLPHAMSILRHCAPFYKYLTMGPELAHMTASALSLTNAKDQSPEYKKDLIHYYKLALFGYHSAWQRLRAHPHVYDADILNHARTEWKLERSRGYREVFSAHYIWDQRFGSTPAPRTLQTTLQIGKVYSIWEDHVLAARWTLVAVQGISVLYGDLHAETEKYRKVLLRIYMDFNLWTFAESHALLMAKKYVERNGGEISLLGGGGWIAEAIGDCSLGLHYLTKAKSFYEIALLDLTYIWGGNDRSQFGILLKLANVERLRHNHAESLQYALKDEKIYQDSLQDSDTFPATARLIDIQVAIASQHFEMGNLGAAKEWCERAFQGPEWNPEIDRNIVVRKRSIWLSRLEAIWIWGCVEHGETDVREWEIPNFNMITKDITREALSTHGPLKRPCCGPGSDAQLNRYGAMTVAEFGAAMFKILDEPHGTDPDEEPVRD